jgi:hypothetical protein
MIYKCEAGGGRVVVANYGASDATRQERKRSSEVAAYKCSRSWLCHLFSEKKTFEASMVPLVSLLSRQTYGARQSNAG